ncbi:MAG: glycoside hydrolase family 2 TIM barrel-domain containing protein [Fimbriimonas sp.]|nr:glycoside hydrolase family 2 TIM barrel-domain containing protein [Fimbriimonas sp.]
MRVISIAILATFLTGVLPAWGSRNSDTIWIEAEMPTTANVKFGSGAPGRPELLSGGSWLTITGEIPGEGAKLGYSFESAEGEREIWHRVGFEAARSPFRWRVDGGPWKLVEPKTPTIDLEELADWNGVAWMDMGSVTLTAGKHTLEIFIPKPEKGDVLYGSDAFALVSAAFHPNGKWQPGEDGRTDRDRLAESHAFEVPEAQGPDRKTIVLRGDWAIGRDDEMVPGPVASPMSQIDQNPVWKAILVPGDKAVVRPDMALAHRVWYRTQLNVPQGDNGKSFVLTFHQNSLNTTVVVNGKLCGFNKNPFVRWSCDITSAMHPGTNDVRVGIRDAWYGFTQDPNHPEAIREMFAFPESRSRMGFLHLDYPVWGCFKSGLLDTPELTVGGAAYASDVFVMPSVAKHRLGAQVRVKNDESANGSFAVVAEAVDHATGKVVKAIDRQNCDIKAGEETLVHLDGAWSDPQLWWPDRPTMYDLRIRTERDGKAIDVSDTPFGFREWTVDGPRYLLNGIVWHGWAELVQGSTPAELLTNYRKTGQRFLRIMGPSQNDGVIWQGMPYDAALDWCDRNGITVRRCGPLDGEAIGYMAIDDRGGINKPLLANVRDQIVAQVLGERNHPSINMWSVENEWLYINCINLYGGLMDDFESDMAQTVSAVRTADPTRLAMTDGGGAGKADVLPVHADHYVYTNEPNDYPYLAYGPQVNGGGRGRWVYDGKRPRYSGEDYFATGINPADYAWIQGEEAFKGKADAHLGMAQVQRMITEGQRWAGTFTAFHLWIGDEGREFHDKYVANAERAMFVREYDWSFGSGTRVKRTFGVFNDSHSSEPLTATWTLRVGGSVVDKGLVVLNVGPGSSSKFERSFKMPFTSTRKVGELDLDLVAGGKTAFRDAKPLVVLPSPSYPKVSLALFDPGGSVAKVLRAAGVAFHPVLSLDRLPADVPNLLVGPDAISEQESTNPRLAAFAADGHRVLVLEQTHPLHFGALPTEISVAQGGGAFGFAEDATHPALTGLTDADLRGWGQNARLYERPYLKAARGIKSIVEVGPRLGQTALAEVPVGKGLIVVSQLQVAHNLGKVGPADSLLANLIAYLANYHRVERPVVSSASDRNLSAAIDAIGIHPRHVPDALSALQPGTIAIVTASPFNLHALAQNLNQVKEFTESGGSLILNGLTPEGLADYNRIVGVDHAIRPFRREKTAVATPRDPLANGLATGDVVMYSGEKMFDFNDDHFVSSDIFSYIVDTGDVAPFAQLPSDYFYNTVNGFVSSDGWKYIFSFELKQGPPEYTMTFPKSFTFTGMTWQGNGFYHKVKRIGLSFDGGPVVAFDVQPNIEPQDLVFKPGQTAKSIRLSILDWTKDPGVNEVVGIDNIWLRVARPADWDRKVKPLLNIGGIVRYPRGKGTIVLVNLAFRDREDVPDNAVKKQSILGTILRNLGAQFSGGAHTIVAGAKDVAYTTVSLAGKANGYRNERGWFGDSHHTLADMPSGRQVFGSVPFDVYDFPTSPVPNAVLLGGPGVPGNLPDKVSGIPIGTKASALFFLQTARLDQRRDDREVREGKRYEMADYVIRYADGSTVKAPIVAEIGVEDYRQNAPHDLAGARAVWSRKYGDTGEAATVYMMQWTNPRPEVAIESIGLEYGPDRRGVPALLAITVAR